MKNLVIYEYIVAIARTGSIRKAATEFSITPSALNRRLLSLESELGIEIFDRVNNGMRINKGGEIVLSVFKSQLSEVNNLKLQIEDMVGLKSGSISIICSQALLPYFLPSQINHFQSLFPEIKFNINVGDGEKAINYIRDFKSDLALIFEPTKSKYIETISTKNQSIQAVMSSEHPLAKFKSIDLIDCLKYPLALPPNPYSVRKILEDSALKLLVDLEPIVEAESYIFLHNFVARNSSAISFEAEIDLHKKVSYSSISTVPLNLSQDYKGEIHLLKYRGRVLKGAVAKFAEQLLNVFEDSN